MGAAVYFWHTLRFDVFHVNPPITRLISGIPVVLCNPTYDWNRYSIRAQDRSEWALGRAFIKANSPTKSRWCFVLGRWALIPLLLLGGYFGQRLSGEMFGDAAACVFLTLWCFSPLLLGWGATLCPDASAAALGIVAVYAFRKWLHKPNWMQAIVAGACLGLLPLSKLTWIAAIGIWPMVWCLWMSPVYLTGSEMRSRPWPAFRQLVVILLVGLYTLNMGYLFDGTFRPLGKYVFLSESFGGVGASGIAQTTVGGNCFAGTWLGVLPVPLPAEFVQGMDTQRHDFERGLPSYLRGEWAGRGWWYYYLYALLIKEPMGMWCLMGIAAGALVFGGSSAAAWRDEAVLLVPSLAIVILVSSQTGFSVHSRYAIPALPLMYVWVSRIGRVFEDPPFILRRRALLATVILALVWSVGSGLSVYPHTLSYFNELAAVLPTPADASYPEALATSDQNRGVVPTIMHTLSAGPRNGPRHLLGSNIDWGQDLFYLEKWHESHPEARPITVAYYGDYPLEVSEIKSAGTPPVGPGGQRFGHNTDTTALGPSPGWHALSVNEIYGRSQQYRYFLNFEPVAMAGYSIYIYHITLDEANQVRRRLGLPELERERNAVRTENWKDRKGALSADS